MSDRWWAPGGDADLLTPGTDARADLGLFLLAAHRAGASAMEDVAKNEITSEAGIVTALAETRAKVADDLVDAVATHLEPTYAALLVRDVLDAGEQGAVDIYRAMVAKGVAPPVAAQRASQTFGLPMRQMGTFASLATDPKANPAVVTDAADRALMSYVSKVADAEAPAVAEVAKAGHPDESRTAIRDTDFDREHPRGPDGRFVETTDAPTQMSTIDRIRSRLGLLAPEPTRVAEVTRTPPQTAQVAQVARVAQVATRPSTRPAREKVTVNSDRVREKVREKVSPEYARQLRSKRRVAPPTVRGPKARIMPDLLHRVPDHTDRTYHQIDRDVVIGIRSTEQAAIAKQAGDQAMVQDQPTRQIFRIGHVVERANYVEPVGRNQEQAHMGSTDREVKGYEGSFHAPKVVPVHWEELSGDEQLDEDILKGIEARMAVKDVQLPLGGVHRQPDREELRHVYRLNPYIPLGAPEDDFYFGPAKYVVHYGKNEAGERPIPQVAEYVIPANEGRGVEEQVGGRNRHLQVELDPNQVYEVVKPPSAQPGDRLGPESFFDPTRNVIVRRWYLRSIDEYEVNRILHGPEDDVHKTLESRDAMLFEQLHPRDEHGQFTEVAQRPTLVSPVARPTRPTAKVAQVAQVAQVARVATRGEQTKPRERVTVNAARPMVRTAASRPTVHPITEAVTRQSVKMRTPDMPVLSDTNRYKVVPENQFQSLMNLIGKTDFDTMHHKPGTPIALDPVTRDKFSTAKELEVDDVTATMSRNIQGEMTTQRANPYVVDRLRMAVPDFEHIAARVHWQMQQHPEADLFELIQRPNGYLYIYAGSISNAHQNVVEYDPELDFSKPMTIRYLGEYRARDVYTRKRGGGPPVSMIGDMIQAQVEPRAEGAVPNPPVHHYRLVAAPVRRYRVDND